jgi:hypothetical protein
MYPFICDIAVFSLVEAPCATGFPLTINRRRHQYPISGIVRCRVPTTHPRIPPYPVLYFPGTDRPPANLPEKLREVFTFSAVSFFLTVSRPGFGGAVNPQPKYKYDHG